MTKFSSKLGPLLASLLLTVPATAASIAGDEIPFADQAPTVLPPPLESAPSPQPAPKSRSERSEVAVARKSARQVDWNTLGRTRRSSPRCQQTPDLASRPIDCRPRLAYCTEFTKPDSLRIFLFGTPHNHRSPPA